MQRYDAHFNQQIHFLQVAVGVEFGGIDFRKLGEF